METVGRVLPDYRHAQLKYNAVKLPKSRSVEHIFFGEEGMVHKELYGWHRVQNRIRAHRVLMANSAKAAETNEYHHDETHDELGLSEPHTENPVHQVHNRPGAISKAHLHANQQSDSHDESHDVDLWVGNIPDNVCDEVAIKDAFEVFGAVEHVVARKLTTHDCRSWAYVKFVGKLADPARNVAVKQAIITPVSFIDEAGVEHVSRVRKAERRLLDRQPIGIWSNLNTSSRNTIGVPQKVMISPSDADARMLLYEICFTGLHAKYEEMAEHQLISLQALDALQEALKKGQDVLVRGGDDTHMLPDPIYLAWHERSTVSVKHLTSAMSFIKPKHSKLLISIKNGIKMRTHDTNMSAYQFKNVEDLMLCAEVTFKHRLSSSFTAFVVALLPR